MSEAAADAKLRFASPRNRYLLPAVWFMAGFSRAVPGVAMRMLLISELRVEPAQQAVLGVWGGLPWNFKIFAAFLSDTVPLCGRRRVPYLGASLMLQLIAYCVLANGVDSVGALGALDFTQACGMVGVGTMADTLIVESMKRLDAGSASFGDLQANCWIAMFVASLVGNALSGHLHATLGTRGVFALTALLKLLMLSLPATLSDAAGHRLLCTSRSKLVELRREIVDGASDPRVWKPVLFLFVFAACPTNADAWTSFLYGRAEEPEHSAAAADATANTTARPHVLQPLHLDETVLGYVGVVTTLSQAAGATLYRCFLKRLRLRPLFASIVAASSLLQLTQLVLIERVNVAVGVPDVAFVLGDDAVLEVSRELLAMPMMVMMAALCPDGAASTVFALLTSVQMAGATLSGSLSSGLTRAVGVRLGDFSRLPHLTLACVAIRLGTLLALGLVPRLSIADLEAQVGRSRRAGGGALRRPRAFAPLEEEAEAGSSTAKAGALPAPTELEHADAIQASAHRRSPFGALLLFTLIGTSLIWSLSTMLTNL